MALSLAAFGFRAGCSAVWLADLSRSIGFSPKPSEIALFTGGLASLVG